MENEELLIGKTIELVRYDSTGEEDKIIFLFTDGSEACITTNASNFLYSLSIEPIK